MLFYDEVFWRRSWNTLIFMPRAPVGIALALGVALLVNADIRGRDVYRTIVFLSYPLMTVAVGIIWRWLYDERVGLINYILRELGLIDQPIAVPAVLHLGAAGRDRRQHLADARLLHDHPAHGPAEHPAEPLRGRGDRRRRRAAAASGGSRCRC